jgi:hypothetical protein
MKTLITDDGMIIRRNDDEASDMVLGMGRFQEGDYEYCPKSEWKKIRPTPKGQGKNKSEQKLT